jgi:hypothetical protein
MNVPVSKEQLASIVQRFEAAMAQSNGVGNGWQKVVTEYRNGQCFLSILSTFKFQSDEGETNANGKRS